MLPLRLKHYSSRLVFNIALERAWAALQLIHIAEGAAAVVVVAGADVGLERREQLLVSGGFQALYLPLGAGRAYLRRQEEACSYSAAVALCSRCQAACIGRACAEKLDDQPS